MGNVMFWDLRIHNLNKDTSDFNEQSRIILSVNKTTKQILVQQNKGFLGQCIVFFADFS